MTESDLEGRLRAVTHLTKLYMPERMVHLVATSSSLCVLLLTAGFVAYNGNASATELGLLFGSSGIVTYTAAQLLRMWERAIAIIAGNESNERD